MKFNILPFSETYLYFWQNQLEYLPDECSFYMSIFNGRNTKSSAVRTRPNNETNYSGTYTNCSRYDFELIINKLSLEVNDRIITRLSGFCGLNPYIETNRLPPCYKTGALQISDDLEYGFAHEINKQNWDIYINFRANWVCLGNPTAGGVGVEFIQNCVAVISNAGEMVALWLIPKQLPCMQRI